MLRKALTATALFLCGSAVAAPTYQPFQPPGGLASATTLEAPDGVTTAPGTMADLLNQVIANQAAASGAIPLTQKGAASGVAALDANGYVTAPLNTTSSSTTGAISASGTISLTSSGASLTGNVSGTTKKWTLGRRSQDTYTSLQSYNGSSWQFLALNDDGTIDTSLGYVANLGADAAFSGLVSAKTLSASTSAFVPDVAITDSTTAAMNTETAAKIYVPLTQKNAASGVAGLDASGNVTAPIKTTGDSEFGGNISLDNGKAFTFHGPSGSTATSAYMYGDGSGNIAVSGGMVIPTLTVSTAATVPDTSTSDSTTAALNTESAAARFIDKETVAANYQTIQDMSVYVRSVSGDLTNPVITGASLSGKTSIDGGKITTDGSGNMAVSGALTATTPATTDNSTNVATTAFVNNAFQAVEYSVQGDISTSGSSIQISFGTSGLYAKFAYTGSGSASMSFYSTSGTLSPVDIRRNSIWGASGVETYTLDNGSVGTAGVTADSTVYTQSQDSSAYFIRVGGQVYFLTVWASNNGARAFMGVHKMI